VLKVTYFPAVWVERVRERTKQLLGRIFYVLEQASPRIQVLLIVPTCSF